MTLWFAALLACKPDPEPTAEVDWDCDPLVPTQCALPFPSTYFMTEDDSTATGWRVTMGATTIPATQDGVQPAPDRWNERDGWSVAGAIIAHFPDASLDGVIGHQDLDATFAADAKTVIVDVATGERVPHWVEQDVVAPDPADRALVLRPAVPLTYGARYVVGIRGLTDTQGQALRPSEAMQALIDQSDPGDERVTSRQPLYDDVIFPALEAQGFARDEVLLAWDFVTASREDRTGATVAMRDDALAWLDATGFSYTIDSIEDRPVEKDEHRARIIKGTFVAPRYTDKDEEGAFLVRGDDGLPVRSGETTVPFTIMVPRTLVTDPRPAPLVQYGHGFFWQRAEVESGYLAEQADRYGWLLFAVDWTGMKEEDEGAVKLMLVGNIDGFAMLPERTQQGLVEQVLAMKLMRGPLASDAALVLEHPVTKKSVPIADPTRPYFYGNSQGAILGGAYVAISPDIERAVLGVGGAPYYLLLHRSTHFAPFFQVMDAMYPDPLDVSVVMGLFQQLWDSGESVAYLGTYGDDPIEGVPHKQLLLHAAVGDAQVSHLGAQFVARAVGASLIDTPVRPIWGLETAASGHTGSAYVEFDYGLPPIPVAAEPPPEDGDPHERPRREFAAQEQMQHFFETGEVVNFCKGPCAFDAE